MWRPHGNEILNHIPYMLDTSLRLVLHTVMGKNLEPYIGRWEAKSAEDETQTEMQGETTE